MRVGIIGTGFGAKVVAPAFNKTEGCSVVAIVSPRDRDEVAALCNRSDIDMISVHSPPFLHERDVTMALQANHHVICDKPFARTLEESERLLAHADSAGVTHLLNFEFRLEPWRRAVRSLIQEGVLGRIESIHWHQNKSYWRHLGAAWELDLASGGGWVGAAISHTVDTLRWLLGELTVHSAVLVRADDHPARAEDGCSIFFGTESGAECTVSSTAIAATDTGSRVVISGSRGAVERSSDGSLKLYGCQWPNAEPVFPSEADSFAITWASWCAAVRDAMVAGKTSLPTFFDGLACDRVLAEIRRVGTVVTRSVRE